MFACQSSATRVDATLSDPILFSVSYQSVRAEAHNHVVPPADTSFQTARSLNTRGQRKKHSDDSATYCLLHA